MTSERSRDRFPDFEEKWQKHWAEQNRAAENQAGGKGEKDFYILSMFPYPSGRLHFGHALPYTLVNAIAAYKRMNGFRVMNPMGWDAFGLPAENAAIEKKIHPGKYTFANIEEMRGQMHAFGYRFDWNREVYTCRPDYYRWTQWIFLKMLERGVAYRKKARVNWCPHDKTTLANEQVETLVKDGEEYQGCFRCGTKVEPREIDAWFLRITDYADRLLAGLDEMGSRWPELVASQQREWIGRSEGVNIEFTARLKDGSEEKLPVFTTRADTAFGVTYVALAAEHPLTTKILNQTEPEKAKKLRRFVDETLAMAERDRASGEEKDGVDTGVRCVNPLNGEEVPLFIANYVLMYGTGAVMAVPAHDERDHEFARGFRLPMKQVIRPADESEEIDLKAEAYTERGVLVNSGDYTGLTSAQAIRRIGEDLKAQGRGGPTVNYKLRDWGISRQRYWGCPIPVVHCAACGIVPVPERDLPVVLPDDVDFLPTGQSPLTMHPEFRRTKCPKCGREDARRDTDTMDTFVDSSWYFLRYADARNDKAIFDADKVRRWCPVDLYVGGREHAILHLIYARFFTMFLHDAGLIDFNEPFTRLYAHGLVQGESLRVANAHMNRYVSKEELAQLVKEGKAKESDVLRRVEKMSKSKKNGADPTDLMAQYGADTVRLTILFLGPASADSIWDEQAVVGCHRFLKRWYDTVLEFAPLVEDLPPLPVGTEWDAAAKHLRHAVHTTIRKATDEFEGRFAFNTAIARCMELVNDVRGFIASTGLKGICSGPDDATLAYRHAVREAFETLSLLLAPIAPHTAEELFHALGRTESVLRRPWPSVDEAALVLDEIEVPVTVNGKVRATLRVARESDKVALESAALENENVQRAIEGKTIAKVVVVPGRIVNLVVR